MLMCVQEIEARQWVSGWVFCFEHKCIARLNLMSLLLRHYIEYYSGQALCNCRGPGGVSSL